MVEEQSGQDEGAQLRETFADLLDAVAQRADRHAYGALFAHFAPRIKAYLLRLGAREGAAEEVTQEVMLTLWRKAARFDRRQASVSTWLFTIARNRRIDLIRREARPQIDPDDPMLAPDPEPRPDDALEATQREARLHAALKDLPAEQAELLQLGFFEGLTHAELAEKLKLPLGTVKSRMRLAFARLKKALDGEV